MKNKKVLFIAPSYMDLYKDIIAEMKKQGYDVDYIKEMSCQDDPYNVRGYARFSKLFVNEDRFVRKINAIWEDILNTPPYDKAYDILFVLDGQAVRPIIFDILKSRNKNLKSINYLFDTTSGVYLFNKNFSLFDKVFTFDVKESKEYNINLLPIYWVAQNSPQTTQYDIFGLGAIKDDRYHLFKRIENIANQCGKSYYLKLFNFITTKNMRLYKLRYSLYKIMRMKNLISPQAILSHFSTKEKMSPLAFRDMITASSVIIDTSAPHQDGMTARFMWAVGLGKKIITTNPNAAKYDFYNSRLILIYNKKTTDEDIHNFINQNICEDCIKNSILIKYRIDNWLKTMLA